MNNKKYYKVHLDLNKCADYPDLFKYKEFKGELITRLNDTLVFNISTTYIEKFIYIPYNWILWMIPIEEENI